MNTRDQFGNYLLLKKLTEDVLGETFRAGRLGKQGVERVALLRVFNGQGLDGEKLAQRIQQRAPLQAALKSPNLAQGIDLGERPRRRKRRAVSTGERRVVRPTCVPLLNPVRSRAVEEAPHVAAGPLADKSHRPIIHK